MASTSWSSAGGPQAPGGGGPRRKDAARSVWKVPDGDEQDGQGDDDEDDEGCLFHGQTFGVTLARAMRPRTVALNATTSATCSPVHWSPKATASATPAWMTAMTRTGSRPKIVPMVFSYRLK